jgi:hypothetical protein
VVQWFRIQPKLDTESRDVTEMAGLAEFATMIEIACETVPRNFDHNGVIRCNILRQENARLMNYDILTGKMKMKRSAFHDCLRQNKIEKSPELPGTSAKNRTQFSVRRVERFFD